MGKREKYKIRFSSYKLQKWTVHVPIIVPLDYLCFKFGNRRAWLLITKNARHYNYIGSKEIKVRRTKQLYYKNNTYCFRQNLKKNLKILSDGKTHTSCPANTIVFAHYTTAHKSPITCCHDNAALPLFCQT